jgi:hypothetical protein
MNTQSNKPQSLRTIHYSEAAIDKLAKSAALQAMADLVADEVIDVARPGFWQEYETGTHLVSSVIARSIRIWLEMNETRCLVDQLRQVEQQPTESL